MVRDTLLKARSKHIFNGEDPADWCPFCYSLNLDYKYQTRLEGPLDNHWFVVCLHCGATGPDARSIGEAIRFWNREHFWVQGENDPKKRQPMACVE